MTDKTSPQKTTQVAAPRLPICDRHKSGIAISKSIRQIMVPMLFMTFLSLPIPASPWTSANSFATLPRNFYES